MGKHFDFSHVFDINTREPYSGMKAFLDKTSILSESWSLVHKVIEAKLGAVKNIKMTEASLLFNLEAGRMTKGKIDENTLRDAFIVMDFQKVKTLHEKRREILHLS